MNHHRSSDKNEKKVDMKCWEKYYNEDGIPLYTCGNKNVQWKHPLYERLLEELIHLNDVKFSAYKIAFKLEKIQKYIYYHEVALRHVIAGFDWAHLRVSMNDELITFRNVETIVGQIYQTNFGKIDSVKQNCCVDVASNFIKDIYDPCQSGNVQVLSLKVILTLLCKGGVPEKISYLYQQIADHKSCISRKRLALLLKEVAQIAEFFSEINSYGIPTVPRAVDSCFTGIRPSVAASEEQFTSWMAKEPESLVWYFTFMRHQKAIHVIHQARCVICRRKPFSGFLYRCTQCLNTTFCQECYLYRITIILHNPDHPVKEISHQITRKENRSILKEILYNKVRRSKTCGLKIPCLQFESVSPANSIQSLLQDSLLNMTSNTIRTSYHNVIEPTALFPYVDPKYIDLSTEDLGAEVKISSPHIKLSTEDLGAEVKISSPHIKLSTEDVGAEVEIYPPHINLSTQNVAAEVNISIPHIDLSTEDVVAEVIISSPYIDLSSEDVGAEGKISSPHINLSTEDVGCEVNLSSPHMHLSAEDIGGKVNISHPYIDLSTEDVVEKVICGHYFDNISSKDEVTEDVIDNLFQELEKNHNDLKQVLNSSTVTNHQIEEHTHAVDTQIHIIKNQLRDSIRLGKKKFTDVIDLDIGKKPLSSTIKEDKYSLKDLCISPIKEDLQASDIHVNLTGELTFRSSSPVENYTLTADDALLNSSDFNESLTVCDQRDLFHQGLDDLTLVDMDQELNLDHSRISLNKSTSDDLISLQKNLDNEIENLCVQMQEASENNLEDNVRPESPLTLYVNNGINILQEIGSLLLMTESHESCY